jgi:hypothetical protein
MKYKFKYRRHFFWKIIEVTGHKIEEDFDKMMLYLPDGGIREIKNWHNYECWLGADWVLAAKEMVVEEPKVEEPKHD